MRCPGCEADTPDGTKFCIECGTPSSPATPSVGRTRSHAPSSVGRAALRSRRRAERRLLRASPIAAAVYPWVFGRENPHLQGCPRMETQAGHRATRRPERLHGIAGRLRSRGGAPAPRPGAGAAILCPGSQFRPSQDASGPTCCLDRRRPPALQTDSSQQRYMSAPSSTRHRWEFFSRARQVYRTSSLQDASPGARWVCDGPIQ